MDDDKLKLLCEEFGLVLRASVVRNDAGKSKGFGFVTFTNKNAQQAAILKLDKRELGGGRVLNVRGVCVVGGAWPPPTTIDGCTSTTRPTAIVLPISPSSAQPPSVRPSQNQPPRNPTQPTHRPR